MRSGSNGFWWIILLFLIFGAGSIVTALLPVFVIAAVIYFAVRSEKKSAARSAAYRRNTNRTYTNRAAKKYSPSELAVINVYLRRFYANNRLLPLADGIDLRMHGSRYSSLSSLDVYRDGEYICTLDEFGARYPTSYDSILESLMERAQHPVNNEEVVDVEVTEHQEEVKEEVMEEPQQEEDTIRDAGDFIAEIDQLNANISDEVISNGLYETCALLKQIQALEQKFPDSRSKLEKLYEYYLPILVRILHQFDNLQSVAADPNYEPTRQKLNRTIGLINDAMKTIISSMTDQDFINLSADMSTLEAVLQKDGYAGDIRMDKHG